MARLPQPGGDDGRWGEILNDFLQQTHSSNGSLKPSSVASTQLVNGAVDETKLSTDVQAKLNDATAAQVTSVAGKTGDVVLVSADVGLNAVNNTSDANKPVSTATQAAISDAVRGLGGYANDGDASGTKTIDATIGSHRLSLTGDVTLTLSGGENGYLVGIWLIPNGYTLTVGERVVTATEPGPVSFWMIENVWELVGGTTEVQEVTPSDVTFVDIAGTADDTYTIPVKQGVVYKLAGVIVEAGTYPGSGAMTIVAEATSGYVLKSGVTTSWTHTFDSSSTVVFSTILTDNFTASDGTMLQQHPTTTGGKTWTKGVYYSPTTDPNNVDDIIITGGRITQSSVAYNPSYFTSFDVTKSGAELEFDYEFSPQADTSRPGLLIGFVEQGAGIRLQQDLTGTTNDIKLVVDNTQGYGLVSLTAENGQNLDALPASGTLRYRNDQGAVSIYLNDSLIATGTAHFTGPSTTMSLLYLTFYNMKSSFIDNLTVKLRP